MADKLPHIPVVYYHSIGPVQKSWNRHFLTLEPVYFEDQARWFSRRFETIFLQEYWEIRNGLRPFRKNLLVITIDDGFLDNWVWAFPILRKYGLKASIFVNPEMADPREIIRPTTGDVLTNAEDPLLLEHSGYLSWLEMREMVKSGLVDIQSHTMTHTRYPVSDEIVDFHHPGADCLYPVGNRFPSRKPFHITDPDFENLLPYGFPYFESSSSVVARKVEINPEFQDDCIRLLNDLDFSAYSFEKAKSRVELVYQDYRRRDRLILSGESDFAYHARLEYEIVDSKRIIEENIGRPVSFLCWPHGDQCAAAHQMALKAGYLATTSGSQITADTGDRIPSRLGLGQVLGNRLLSKWKARYKLGSNQHEFPYAQLEGMYHRLKYGARKPVLDSAK